jgi:NSS family neurotransmitter:Na+ symporter
MEKEFYKSRLTFILFALASVIGLGGIWRFSYVVGMNGGGSFLIIYLICLFAIGIPLVIAELALGGKTGRSAPLAFKEIRGKAEWMGWLQIINLAIIWFYYAVLVGWCLSYIFFSLKGSYFGVNSESFFSSYLGSFVPLIAAFIIWAMSFPILAGGIKRHEKFTLITLPLTWVFLLILAVRAITLPGAVRGLDFFLKPDFSRMADLKTWATAIGQLFFALSIATASLPVFSRCLKKTEIANSGFIISLGDIAFAFLAGIVIFPAVFAFGFEPAAGTKLAFITLPALITKMPLGQFFGVIFFTLLMLSGWDSITTVFETHLQAINEKTNVSRKKIALFLCLLGFIGSAVIARGFMNGKDLITPLDTIFGTYGLLVLGLIEVIFFGWIWGAEKIREFVNENSDFKIGKWFDFCLKIICPVAILIVISALIIG